jgi:hypothetical protein
MAPVMSLMVGGMLATAGLAAPVHPMAVPMNNQANVAVAATFPPVPGSFPTCHDFPEECRRRDEAVKACKENPQACIMKREDGDFTAQVTNAKGKEHHAVHLVKRDHATETETGDFDGAFGALPPLVPNVNLPVVEDTVRAPKVDERAAEEYHHGWIEYGTLPGNNIELHPEGTPRHVKDVVIPHIDAKLAPCPKGRLCISGRDYRKDPVTGPPPPPAPPVEGELQPSAEYHLKAVSRVSGKKPPQPLSKCPEDRPGSEPVICIPGKTHSQSPAAREEAKRKAREEAERQAREESEVQASAIVPELTFPDPIDFLPGTGLRGQRFHHSW